MGRKRQQERDDEPAVTFELEEAPRDEGRSKLGTAGAAAVTGAGLAASGAAPDAVESLDVFDQTEADPAEPDGDVPVTSFEDLVSDTEDPEFPPIDFEETSTGVEGESAANGGDTMFGASSDVGGGFTLEDAASDEAFGASDGNIDVEPVPDVLSGDPNPDDAAPDLDDTDDFDFT